MKKDEKLNKSAVNETQAARNESPMVKEQTSGGGAPMEVVKAQENTAAEKLSAAQVKPVLSIDEKLKLVDDLNRLRLQRENLLARIAQLEAFEIAVAEEADELADNEYQNCKLIITDDRGLTFKVQSAGLIKMTVGYIREACKSAQAAIEEKIIFPSAA